MILCLSYLIFFVNSLDLYLSFPILSFSYVLYWFNSCSNKFQLKSHRIRGSPTMYVGCTGPVILSFTTWPLRTGVVSAVIIMKIGFFLLDMAWLCLLCKDIVSWWTCRNLRLIGIAKNSKIKHSLEIICAFHIWSLWIIPITIPIQNIVIYIFLNN